MREINRKVQSGEIKVCGKCGEAKDLADFRDGSLTTKYGRFCRACKSEPHYSYHYEPVRAQVNEETLTRKETNRLLSFTEAPEKYATGSETAKAKVQELVDVSHKFSDGQTSNFESAYRVYTEALKLAQERKSSRRKEDYAPAVQKALNERLTLNMRYKGLVRDVYPYAADDTYCIAYCTFRKELRTFRIDRMVNVKIGAPFSFDASLQRSAQGRVGAAHAYRK